MIVLRKLGFGRKKKVEKREGQPPTLTWWDLLRFIWKLPSGLAVGLIELARKYGTTFELGGTLFSGNSEDENFILSNPNFVQGFLDMLRPMLDESLQTSEHESWQVQREQIAEISHGPNLVGFRVVAAEVARKVFATWKSGKHKNLVPDIKQLTLQSLLGMMFRDLTDEDREELMTGLPAMMESLDHGMPHFFLSKVGLGWLADIIYWRAKRKLKKREIVVNVVKKYVEKRMQGEVPDGFDAIGSMYQKGMPLDLLVNNAIVLLIGGYDTTQAVFSMMTWLLTKYPKLQEEIRAESMAANGNFSFKTMPKLEKLYGVVMHFAVPAVVNARRATKDLTLPSGFTIKAGSFAVVVPILEGWANHRPNAIPLHMRPDFWDQNVHESYKKRRGFGSGIHSCPGSNIAQLEIPIWFGVALSSGMRFVAHPKARGILPKFKGVLGMQWWPVIIERDEQQAA